MPLTQGRPLRRSVTLAVASLSLVIGMAASVRAADGGGFFERLFGPAQTAPVAAPASQAAPQAGMPSPERYYGRRHGQRTDGMRLRPKIRYAALPRPEPLKVRITDRQMPLDMKAGATAALLKDETLRPGDIVILKDGARVFTGRPDKRHTLSDFDSITGSSFIDRQTRTLLAAMLLPVGALPASEARKIVARMKQSLPAAAPVQVEASMMRVIYPWKRAE